MRIILAADAQDKAIGERLETVIGGMSIVDAAAIALCSPMTFRRWLKGQVSADAKGLSRIASAKGVSLEWLIDGRGSMTGSPEPASDAAADESFGVPIVDVVAGAGGGQEVLGEEITGYLAFPRSELRRLGNPENLQLIRVRGDSQAPELRDGDLAMVDISKFDRMEGLLVVSIDNHLVAKRLRLRGGGKAELLSANESYPPIEIDLTRRDVAIKGRIVWAGKVV